MFNESHVASIDGIVIFVKFERKSFAIDKCADTNNKAVHGIAIINNRKKIRSSTNATCCHSSKRC